MPIQPIDKRGPRHSRDGMWQMMMKLGTFSIKEISGATSFERSTISSYLLGLEKAGYVSVKRELGRGVAVINTYTVIRKNLDTPRLRKDGTEVTQGTGTAQMWRSIKMMASFTPLDLSVHASTTAVEVHVNAAKDYIKHLHKAGYLRLVKTSKPGKQAVYSKVADRSKYGAKPLQIQRVKQVYDPNIGKVVWPLPVKGGAK